MPNPILPRNEADPTGLAPTRRRADARLTKMMQIAARDIRSLVAKLPHTIGLGETSRAYKSETRKASLVANADFVVNYIGKHKLEIDNGWLTINQVESEAEMMITNRAYTWQVDNFLMDQTMSTIRRILTDSLLSGDTSWQQRWWMNGFLDPSYERGTTESFYSAQQITQGIDSPSTNAIAIMDAEAQLQTAPYLNRLQLLHGRVFEDMQGIVGDTVKQLRTVLTDGMARGLGIRDISGMINSRVGVGLSRARSIARTEINRAYNTAYMDESEELNKNLKEDDYSIREMHVSALIPSITRKTHSERHGTIHTRKEQMAWWGVNGNSNNCYCTVISVLINLKTGEILQEGLVKRTRERGKQYFRVHGTVAA